MTANREGCFRTAREVLRGDRSSPNEEGPVHRKQGAEERSTLDLEQEDSEDSLEASWSGPLGAGTSTNYSGFETNLLQV